MSFDQFLGHPFMASVMIPPPASTPDVGIGASADATSGRFRAATGLNPGRGITTVAARIGAALAVPAGCTKITVRFKYSYEHFTNAWIVPGPGFVSASCGLDYLILRRRPSTGVVDMPAPPERRVLAHTWVPALGNGHTGVYTVENLEIGVQLPQSAITAAGEVWTVFLRPYAETGGGGLLFAGATAQITGTVYGFRVIGA